MLVVRGHLHARSRRSDFIRTCSRVCVSISACILWSSPLLLLYAAFRRYLQGIHVVTPVMIALVTANLVNAAFNWVLIYGHLGMPALGVAGSAWATLISRVYMAAFLAHRHRALRRSLAGA